MTNTKQNDKNSRDVTGRQYFDVVVRDENGETLVSWHPRKDQVFISDNPSGLRWALVSINELSKFVSEWVAVEPLPRKSLGFDGTQKPDEIRPSPVIDTAGG